MQVTKWMKASIALVSAAGAAMTLGCSPQPMTPAAAVNDRFYPVTPDAMTVKAGIVSGQVTDMKVMERVEAGSGRITAPAKLTAKLVIKNVSADQAVRLLGAKITYIDHKGLPIVLEEVMPWRRPTERRSPSDWEYLAFAGTCAPEGALARTSAKARNRFAVKRMALLRCAALEAKRGTTGCWTAF